MSEARLRLEPLGVVGFYVYFDDKLMDIFHLSDLRHMAGLNQKTLDAIEQIYNDLSDDEE